MSMVKVLAIISGWQILLANSSWQAAALKAAFSNPQMATKIFSGQAAKNFRQDTQLSNNK